MPFDRVKALLKREEQKGRESAQRKREAKKAEQTHWDKVQQQLEQVWASLEIFQILEELKEVLWPEMEMERDNGLHIDGWGKNPVGFLRAWIFETSGCLYDNRGYSTLHYDILCSFRLYRDRLDLFLGRGFGGQFYEALYLDQIGEDPDVVRKWLEGAVIRWKKGKPGQGFGKDRIPWGVPLPPREGYRIERK